LHAREEHEAGALACEKANRAHKPDGVVPDLLVLGRDHYRGHHLTKHDESATQNRCLFGVENFEEEAGKNAKERETIERKVEPVEDFVLNVVLLLNEVEVAGICREGEREGRTRLTP